MSFWLHFHHSLLCFCLKKLYLKYVNPLTLNSWPAVL